MDHSNPSPPKFLLRFFRWYCHPDMAEELEGDLIERFEIRVSKKGHKKARQLFIRDVFQLFRPGIVRPLTGSQKLNSFGMLKNNLIVAKRQLLRHKMYSSIKIGGFALGVAVCLLISLFIRDELSYDQHVPEHETLYRIVKEYDEVGGINKYTWFQAPFARTMMADYPEVTLAGRTMESENMGAGYNNLRKEGEATNHYEDGFIFADQQILDMFQFPMVYGNLKDALAEPFTMVLTRKKAEKLYPGENPIGKTVFINDNTAVPYKIGGVMEDLPENSFFDFNYIWSLTDWEFWNGEQTNWRAQNYQLFAKLKPGTDVAAFTDRIQEMSTKYLLPPLKNSGMVNAAEFINSLTISMQPVADIHLRSADVTDVYEKSDIKYIWIFGIVAMSILALACINFVNLSTAKSANRAKEVGLRKTIGSVRSQLIGQFLTESIVYSLLSFVLAIGLAYLLLPYFNQLAGKELVLPWTSLWFIPTLLGAAVLIGTFAGIYPAFYLSSFKPSSVLKGNLSLGSKRSGLRNSLVVIQFTASIILITGTFVVYQQMDFILNTKTGFDKDQVVLLKNTLTLRDKGDAFKAELQQIPEVQSTTISGYLPVTGTLRDGDAWWIASRTKEDPSISAQIWNVDEDYFETLGIQLAMGRNFDKKLATENFSVLINQTMAKQLGIADDPLGQEITSSPSNNFRYKVIGVVEDFNYDLLTEKVKPVAMRLGNSPSMTAIKVNGQNMVSTLTAIEKAWDTVAPNQPFVYEFMDQRFATMYAGVQRIRNILTFFATLAVLIACLGLFGLSVFMAEQRKKEISVRLVLGAKVRQIVSMLGINFIKPIVLALIVASPVAWYIMREWLNGFEYKTDLSISLFITAGASALLIALITISFQSLKAAFSSPVDGLRDE